MKKELKLFSLMVVMLTMVATHAFAGGNSHTTHYGKVTVNSDGNGNGSVYIGTTNNASSGKEVETWNCGGSSGNDSKTYYLFAKPNVGYEVRWDGNGSSSTDNPFKVSLEAVSDLLGSPTTFNYTATFQKKSVIKEGFTNPILPIDAADPTVLLADDGYYYMSSSEEGAGAGLPLWRSADMVNWTCISRIFPNGNKPAELSFTFLWAPELVKVGDKYVLFFANAAYGEQQNTQICVATADQPYGPYTYQRSLLSVSGVNGSLKTNVNNVIDPSLFIDDDGKKYLVWGSFNGVYYIVLSDDCTSLKSGATAKALVDGTSGDWKNIEAPMLVKRDGYYYLIASKGTTVNASNASDINYKLVVARGRQLGGQFNNMEGNSAFGTRTTYMSDLLVGNDYVLGPGHSSQIITDKNGTEWIFYHGYSKNNGNWDYPGARKLFADKVLWGNWVEGWPGIMPYDGSTIESPEIDEEKQVVSSRQIYTAADLVQLATDVNTGNPFINAILMSDIDMSGVDWTPIGTADNRFQGIIDGQGFRIKNLRINKEGVARQGLVGTANGGAQFKNLILDSSCEIIGGDYTGGFIGRIDGNGTVSFLNCGNEAHIRGGQNTAGFVGCDTGVSLFFDNCYNTGNIDGGSESAAFSGWGIDRLRNCWNTGRTIGCQGAGDGKWYSMARDWNDNKNVNSYDLNSDNAPLDCHRLADYESSWMTNGRLCYALNDGAGNIVWYQNIEESFGENKDAHPTFLSSHEPVFIYNKEYHNYRDDDEKTAIENALKFADKSIADGEYYTICLPYATSETSGAKFFTVAGVKKENDAVVGVVLQSVEDDNILEAGKPYVYRADGSTLSITYSGSPVITKLGRAYGMVGNLTGAKIEVPVGCYYLKTADAIAQRVQGKTATIGNQKAYFDFSNVDEYLFPSASAREVICMGFNGTDSPDAISNITVTSMEDTPVYNMMGQRVNNNAKGILIKNGRKVLVK